MDEVDFLRGYNNCRTMIDDIRGTGDTMVVTHIANTLLTMLAMLDSLNQRLLELQAEEDDE